MSELEKIRDELAEVWWAKINTGMGVSIHATSIYKAGFDAAVRELTPMIDELILLMYGCSDGNCVLRDRDGGQHTNGGCRCKRNAKSLLAKYKEWHRE